jgi:hypothetical protein
MDLPPETCRLIDQTINSLDYEIQQEDVGEIFLN